MSTIESGLASGFAHDVAALFGNLYRVNGWDPMSVWDGFRSNAVAAGISQPATYSTNVTSAALGVSSGVSPGVHFFRYRYANSKTQYVSNPSEAKQFTAAEGASGTGATYTFSNIVPSPDVKVDRIIAEMTDSDGEVFFQASVLQNESQAVTIRINDDDLRALPLLYDEFGHDVPPRARYVEPFKGRLWLMGQIVYEEGQARIPNSGISVVGSGTNWNSTARGRLLQLSGDTRRFIESVVSGSLLLLEESVAKASAFRNYTITDSAPDILRWSKALFPESFPVENQTRVLDGKPEKARAHRGYRNDLIIWGERSMQRLVFASDPNVDGALEPIEGDRGAASRLCVVDAGGAVFSLDYKGIHRYTGGSGEPQHVSESIDPLFDPADNAYGYVDFAYRSTFHAVHFPNRHQIVWFVVVNGVTGDSTAYTTPHHAIVFDYLNQTFGLWKFDVAMVASTIAPGANGTTQTVICDENGRSWVLGIGTTDGVHSASAVKGTVQSGATATSIPLSVATNLYAANSGLAGAGAYSPQLDALATILSNSANGVTLVGSGFLVAGVPTAPSVGTEIFLGRIPAKFKSKAFVLREPSDIQEPRYLHLAFEPKGRGTARVRFYLNRSSTAYAGWAVDIDADGLLLSALAGRNYIEVDLTRATGYARIPMPESADDGDSNAENDAIYTVEVEVETVGADPIEINQITVDGMTEEEDQEA